MAAPVTQSALQPHGPAAQQILEIGWVLLVGATIIFVAVIALALYATLRRSDRPSRLASVQLVAWAGFAFPVVALSGLLIYGFSASAALVARPADPLRIEVTGFMWWWRISYPQLGFETANEIRIPTGRPVELSVRSADVIHSFWVPPLHGKIDLVPGRVNRLAFSADKPGVLRGQCAEYCGLQHARMGLLVVTLPPAEFDRWTAVQVQPPAPAALARRGADLFLRGGCGGCHTVRGLPHADGLTAPDLTHVGGRLGLAAATLPVDRGSLAAWISRSQHLKPGNAMPSFRDFAAADLDELAAWLEELE